MFGRFLSLFLGLASVAVLSVGSFFREAFALFRVDVLPMLAGGPSLAMVGGPSNGIGSALFNFNRHESAVSQRSADRNI